MRNLKRALSLVLAALMLIGMMVVSAGAAGVDDFSDKDEIVNKDAVNMLTILGVVNGKEDGSYFDPTGDVTRAEMAKMIATILNQGADVNDLYASMDTGLTDIDNSWAKGYINYCYSLGIIAGRGNGTFDPTAPVTGNEAAKMLLVAIGYDPEIEGLTGAAWAIKTTALASTLGIFDDLTAPTNENLSRDNAALVIYNALDVEMIQSYTTNGYALVYNDHRTLLSNKYGVYKVEGVVIANEWAELDGTDSDATAAIGKTTLENVVVYESTTSNTTVAGNPENLPVTFNVSTPVDYMGKAVTMYVKKTTILANSSVLGVTVNDNMNVVQSTVANTTEVKDLLKGTGLDVNSDTEYYVNYGSETAASSAALINNYAWGENGSDFNLNGVKVELIDNDNDGDVEYVLYLRETLSNVIRTSDKDETVTLYAPVVNNAGILSNGTRTMVLDNADVVTDLDLAADDLVLYTQYGGRTYITAPTIVTGKMTRVDRDKANELYVTLDDGETYKQSYIREVESVVDADIERFVIADAKDDIGFTTEYDFILDSNGYIVAYRPTEAVVDNYALVVGSAWTQNALTKEGQVKVVTADGTTASYDINWDASADAFASEAAMEKYLGTRDVDQGDGVNTLGAAAGTVIEYTLSDDNILTITHVLQLNDLNANGDLRVSTNRDKDAIDVGTNANGQPVAYIAENNNAEVVIGGSSFMPANSTPNLQYTLTNKYENGDGTIYVTAAASGENKTYAIDQNTIAFYYDGDGYAAIGWDEMGDVAAGTPVQIYQDVKKSGGDYTATNLVDVVLFNAELTTNTADYLLVLSANAVDANNLELNVVLEDGTVETITVDKSHYTWFDNDANFMAAYPYSVNADGEYTIKTGAANMIGRVDALLLEDGTVDATDMYTNYLTISKDSAIWDVTDAESADDQVSAGSFDRNQVKNAVIVTDDNGRVVRTAWVWDSDIIYVDSTASVAELNRALRDAQYTTQQQVRIDGDFYAPSKANTPIVVPENVTLTVTGTLTMNPNASADMDMDLNGHLKADTWVLNGAYVDSSKGTGSYDVKTLYAGSILGAGLTGTAQNVVLNDTVTIAADITVTGDVTTASTAPAGTKIVTTADANIVVKGTVYADVDNTAGGTVTVAGMVGTVTGTVIVNGTAVTNTTVNQPAEGGTTPAPEGSYTVTVKVDGVAVKTENVKENASFSYTYTAAEGKVIDTASIGTIAADKKSVTISIEQVTAETTITITTKTESTSGQTDSELPAATVDEKDATKLTVPYYFSKAPAASDYDTIAADIKSKVKADLGIDLGSVTVTGAAAGTAIGTDYTQYTLALEQYVKVTVNTDEVVAYVKASKADAKITGVAAGKYIDAASVVASATTDANTAGEMTVGSLTADKNYVSAFKITGTGVTVSTQVFYDANKGTGVQNWTALSTNVNVAAGTTLLVRGVTSTENVFNYFSVNGVMDETTEVYGNGGMKDYTFVVSADNANTSGECAIAVESGIKVVLDGKTLDGVYGDNDTIKVDKALAGNVYVAITASAVSANDSKAYKVTKESDAETEEFYGQLALTSSASSDAVKGVLTLVPATKVVFTSGSPTDFAASGAVVAKYGDKADYQVLDAVSAGTGNTIYVAVGATLTITGKTGIAGDTITVTKKGATEAEKLETGSSAVTDDVTAAVAVYTIKDTTELTVAYKAAE